MVSPEHLFDKKALDGPDNECVPRWSGGQMRATFGDSLRRLFLGLSYLKKV